MSRVLRNTTIYTIGNIVPRAIGFLLLPIFTRFLTPEDYGIVASMAVLGGILDTLYTLCIHRAVPRLFFDYKEENDQRNFLGTNFISITAISVIVLFLIFLFRGYIGRIYKEIPFYPFYIYAITTVFLTTFSYIPQLYLQIKERARDFVVLSLSPFVIGVLLALWFVCVLKQGAVGRLKASLITACVFFPIYIAFNLRIINFRFNLSILKQTLSFSLPFIPTLLCAWVLTWSDRIFIERFFNLHEVGIYSLGYTLAMISIVISQGFASAYSPVFYRLANWGDIQKSKKNLKRYNNTYVLAFLFLCFFIALFSKEIVTFFMDARYREAYRITRIIVFAYFFGEIMSIISLSLMQSKKTKENMYIAIGIAFLNIILNFIFISRYGMYGAAIATLLSFVAGCLIMYQYSRKCFFIPLRWNIILFWITFMIVALLVYSFQIEKNMYVSLVSKSLLLCIAGGVLLTKWKVIMNKFSELKV